MLKALREFLETFVHPDKDDHPEKAEVSHAANLLQIGEFQILQLAYRKAYGRDMEEGVTDRLFAAYMLHNEVPSWALRYARHIRELDDRNMLTDQDPTYHLYDSDYYNYIPEGIRKFAIAVGVIVLAIGGAIFVSHMTEFKRTSVLPPYFDPSELQQNRPKAEPADKPRRPNLQGS